MTAPGWYPDPNAPGVQRYWDGGQWTEHVAAQGATTTPVQVLPTRMVTKSPKRTSHTFHLIMTVLTFGIWGLVVWLPLTILHKFQHEKSVTNIR